MSREFVPSVRYRTNRSNTRTYLLTQHKSLGILRSWKHLTSRVQTFTIETADCAHCRYVGRDTSMILKRRNSFTACAWHSRPNWCQFETKWRFVHGLVLPSFLAGTGTVVGGHMSIRGGTRIGPVAIRNGCPRALGSGMCPWWTGFCGGIRMGVVVLARGASKSMVS